MSTEAASTVEAIDIFTLSQTRRVAAMLDIDPQRLSIGDPIPRGWHFAMLAGETPRHVLRSDGFPGLGIPMRQMDRPRLLLGQRSTSFHRALIAGASLRRRSSITSIAEKTGRNGQLSIVKVEHSLSGDGGESSDQDCVVESQTYYLAALPSSTGATAEAQAKSSAPALATDGEKKVVTPDDLMLFQYSALGFNTHRIHFDRDYATRVEGHPDLVVNGGLATLLATEFVRTDLGKTLKTMSARHLAPLYVNRPLTIFAPDLSGADVTASIIDCDGNLAAELVMTFDEL